MKIWLKIGLAGLAFITADKISAVPNLWPFSGSGGSLWLQESLHQGTSERVRLVHADSLINVFEDGKEFTELFGHVRLVQGEAYLECRQAKLWHAENKAILMGDVNIYDGKRSLTGDRVEYNGKIRTEQAIGNVCMQTGDRRLTSHKLTYSQESEVADAEGNVVITDLVEKATIMGDTAMYDRRQDYGLVRGNPMLTRLDSVSGDTMAVRGLVIEAWGDDQHVVVTDSVVIEKGDLKAACRKAAYFADDDSLILEKLPIVRHRDHQMLGERIDIFLEGMSFRGGIIRGRAEIISTDSLYQDVLKGREIYVEVQRDTIRKVIVDGQASSLYHVFEEDGKIRNKQGINTVTGDRIEIFFDGDRLNQVVVKSNPAKSSGTYKPEDMRRKVDKRGEGI